AGGQVCMPPFDVFDIGRMAAILDPTGAAFCIWQPKTHHGVGIENVPGTFCWADLMTKDIAAARKFYEQVFGWQMSSGEHDNSGYRQIKTGDALIGGIPPAHHQTPIVPPPGILFSSPPSPPKPPAGAKKRGPTGRRAPATMEQVGDMSIIADPQGATF